MHDEPIVVVGGGAGAHALVGSYTEAGGERDIVIVSDDGRLPCFRPHLTKEYLRGEIGEDALDLDDESWYAHRHTSVRLGCRATDIDITTRSVATDAGPVRFDQLVVATGSSAASLKVPGGDNPQLLAIRRPADSKRVIDTIANGAPVLVIGSGFVGCEAATSLRARGLDVTMVGMESAPQVGRLGAAAATLIAGWLRGVGVTLRLSAEVAAIESVADGLLTRLGDGSVIVAGHVLVATGARPNLDVVGSLASDDGVPVDASMRTAVDRVFAIGDIAFAHNVAAGRPLRVEHWGDAEKMGTVAGQVLAGHHAEWNTVPGFWSNIAGQQLKYTAWGDGWDEMTVDAARPDGDDALCIWYGHEGVLVGALTYNRDDAFDIAPQLIAARTPLSGVPLH